MARELSRGGSSGSHAPGASSGAPVENGGERWRAPANRAEAIDLVSDSDSESDEDASGSDHEEEPSWIQWFCSLRGNEFFCEIDEDYIEDDFNLSGLSSQVPYYDYALDMILDNDPPHDVMLTDQQHELLESAAEMLYGLIHARYCVVVACALFLAHARSVHADRYIVTARGLAAMLEKFKNCDFGRCPRCLCEGQACLPVGTSDIPGQSTVKVFCPKCEDIYYPRCAHWLRVRTISLTHFDGGVTMTMPCTVLSLDRSEYQCSIDGAYFSTTFPHLMMMTYPTYRPPKSVEQYVPRVFGFKLHPSAYGNR